MSLIGRWNCDETMGLLEQQAVLQGWVKGDGPSCSKECLLDMLRCEPLSPDHQDRMRDRVECHQHSSDYYMLELHTCPKGWDIQCSVLNLQRTANTVFYLTQKSLIKLHSLGNFYNDIYKLCIITLKQAIIHPAQQTKNDPLAWLCKMEVSSRLLSSSG